MDDFPDLPEFLKVENNVPLTPEQEARLALVRANLQIHHVDRWREREQMRKDEKRDKGREQSTATRKRQQRAKHKLAHPDPVEARLIRLGMLKPRNERLRPRRPGRVAT